MAECPTRDQLRALVRTTGSALRESSPAFESALVLTAGLHFGTRNTKRLSEATGVPISVVERYAARLRVAGIWTEDGRTAGGWNGPQDEMAFWCDVNVALGLFATRARR